MVSIAQLVRASDCGSEGRGFEPHCSPYKRMANWSFSFFVRTNTTIIFPILFQTMAIG